MASEIADRLSTQETEIRWLSDEIGRLLELGTQGTIEVDPNPTLVELRAENDKLKYRLAHLQSSLKEEQARAGPESQSADSSADTAGPQGEGESLQQHGGVCADTEEVLSIVE